MAYKILVVDDETTLRNTVRAYLEEEGYTVQTANDGRMALHAFRSFQPDLVVLDGLDAFVDGGPATGKHAKGNVFIASTDRVAIDAVGVAILKSLGSNGRIMKSKIFEQEQIARAAELGLGASSPSDIAVIPVDENSREYGDKVTAILNQG